MKTKIMHIRTPYGDYYDVDLHTGYIKQSNVSTFSGGWEFRGFSRVTYSRFHVDISLRSIREHPEILRAIQWKYKNGHPRYTVLDCDYGTNRKWGNYNVHGVSEAWTD